MFCKKCKSPIKDGYSFCPACGKKLKAEIKKKSIKRGNGEGSIYKMHGNRKKPWAIMITEKSGKRNYIGSAASAQEAAKILESYKLQDKPSGWNLTVNEVYALWSESHYQSLTDSGISGYSDAWKRFSVYSNLKMKEIKTSHIQKIIDGAILGNGNPLSKSGKEKIRQLASQLCKWAMQQDIINKNYAEFVKINGPESKEKEIFTSDEIAALKKVKHSYDAQIVLVLIYTGMRINELFNMKLCDVHLPTHMIGGEKTKAGIRRTIPIHPEILSIIESWVVCASKTQEYLVVNTAETKINDDNWRKRNYYPLLENLKIRNLSPHSTRHTFATLMRRAGVKEELLARIVGHSKFSTTAGIYIHTDTNELYDAVKKI